MHNFVTVGAYITVPIKSPEDKVDDMTVIKLLVEKMLPELSKYIELDKFKLNDGREIIYTGKLKIYQK